MSRQRHEDLNDEALDRELRAALAVDPPPAFVAKVRARVAAEELERTHTYWHWLKAPAVALLVVVVLLARPQQERSALREPATEQPREVRARALRQTPVPEPAVARAAPPAPSSSPEGRKLPAVPPDGLEPDILVARGEAEALRRLFERASEGRLELPSDQPAAVHARSDAEASEPAPIPEIVIQPLEVPPASPGALP